MLEIFYISYQTPNIVLLKLFYIWKCFTAKQMEYEYTCSTIRKFILFGKEDQMIFLLMKWIKLSPLYHSLIFFFLDEPLYHSYPKSRWVVKSFFYVYFLRKWLSNPYIAEREETAHTCWPSSFTTFMLFSNLSQNHI